MVPDKCGYRRHKNRCMAVVLSLSAVVVTVFSQKTIVGISDSSKFYIRDQICIQMFPGQFSMIPDNETNEPLSNSTSEFIEDAFPWFVYTNLTGDTSDLIKQICPNIQFCKDRLYDSETEKDIVLDECCFPCGCTRDCHVVGNCCPDAELPPQLSRDNVKISQHSEECLYPEIIGSSSCQKGSTQAYMMIRTCPFHFENISQVNACIFPDFQVPETTIPVYSLSTGRTYANIHCAECNDDKGGFQRWTAILKCMEFYIAYDYFSEINEINYIEKLPQSGCSILWKPPEGSNVTRCYFEENLISHCSRTLEIPENNHIEKLCHTTTKIPYGRQGTMYKNVFCFGCSSYKEDMVTGSCRKRIDSLAPPSFSAVMNLPDGTENIRTFDNTYLIANARQCPEGFRYHVKTEECLIPSCPMNTFEKDDGCMPIFKTLSGVQLNYQMHIRSTTGDTINIQDALRLARSFVVYQNEDASICYESSNTIVEDGVPILVVDITKAVESNFVFDDYLQKFNSMINSAPPSIFKIQTAKSWFSFMGSFRFGVNFNSVQQRHIFSCGFFGIAMSNIQVCNAIKFPIDFSDAFIHKPFTFNNVTFQPSEYVMVIREQDQPFIHICLETYEKKKRVVQDINGSDVPMFTYLCFGTTLLLYAFLFYVYDLVC